MLNVGFEVKGAKECADQLQRFDTEVRTKMVKEASREAVKIVRAEAVQNAPEDTGRLKELIGSVTFYASRIDAVVSKVGMVQLTDAIAKKKGTKGNPLTMGAYYARFTEVGTEHQRGQHWMKRALDATKEKFANRFVVVLQKKIDRYLSATNKGK